jgi:hypothetical protein
MNRLKGFEGAAKADNRKVDFRTLRCSLERDEWQMLSAGKELNGEFRPHTALPSHFGPWCQRAGKTGQ